MIEFTPDTLELVLKLVDLILDAKAARERLVTIKDATHAMHEARAAADQVQTALAARIAALDAREDKIAEAKVETARLRAGVEDQKSRLIDIQRDIDQRGDAFKRAIMGYAGILQHHNELLQSLPDWDALAHAVFGPSDAHFGEEIDAGEFEPVPGAVAGSTITRSSPTRRSMRRLEQHQG